MTSTTQNAQIANDKVVTISYLLTNGQGKELDRATNEDPFTYLHGSQQVLPGLEDALEGLTIGDRKKVTLKPADGYGEVDPKLRFSVSRAELPKGVDIQTGMQFSTPTEEGDLIFTVQAVHLDRVELDGNHPLAGETLNFDVEVIAVRDATEEELSHGHAHGEGGHHH